MEIIFKFEAYVGAYFIEKESKNHVKFDDIKNIYFIYNNKKGKIFFTHTTDISEQGYQGSYDNYIFVYENSCNPKKLKGNEVFLCKEKHIKHTPNKVTITNGLNCTIKDFEDIGGITIDEFNAITKDIKNEKVISAFEWELSKRIKTEKFISKDGLSLYQYLWSLGV
jgi:hypothetical protein